MFFRIVRGFGIFWHLFFLQRRNWIGDLPYSHHRNQWKFQAKSRRAKRIGRHRFCSLKKLILIPKQQGYGNRLFYALHVFCWLHSIGLGLRSSSCKRQQGFAAALRLLLDRRIALCCRAAAILRDR